MLTVVQLLVVQKQGGYVQLGEARSGNFLADHEGFDNRIERMGFRVDQFVVAVVANGIPVVAYGMDEPVVPAPTIDTAKAIFVGGNVVIATAPTLDGE